MVRLHSAASKSPRKSGLFACGLARDERKVAMTTVLILLALAALAFPLLYGVAVRAMLRRNLARLRKGDLDPLVKTFAGDVHFIFPGESSWAADLRGPEAVA